MPLRYRDDAHKRGIMLALNDSQLELVMAAAAGVAPEKRSVFLERVAAKLGLRGSRFSDVDRDRDPAGPYRADPISSVTEGSTMTFSKEGDRPVPTPLDELRADMTPADIAFVLRDLRFSGGFRTIKLDSDARNYLLDSVLARIKPPR
jgi:hypothetical protein